MLTKPENQLPETIPSLLANTNLEWPVSLNSQHIFKNNKAGGFTLTFTLTDFNRYYKHTVTKRFPDIKTDTRLSKYEIQNQTFTNVVKGSKTHSVKKRQSIQESVLQKLDIYVKQNYIGPLPYTM